MCNDLREIRFCGVSGQRGLRVGLEPTSPSLLCDNTRSNPQVLVYHQERYEGEKPLVKWGLGPQEADHRINELKMTLSVRLIKTLMSSFNLLFLVSLQLCFDLDGSINCRSIKKGYYKIKTCLFSLLRGNLDPADGSWWWREKPVLLNWPCAGNWIGLPCTRVVIRRKQIRKGIVSLKEQLIRKLGGRLCLESANEDDALGRDPIGQWWPIS